MYLQRGWDPDSGEVLHAEAGMWRATQDGVLAATIAQPRTAEVSEGTISRGLIVLASTNVGRAAHASPLVATQRTYRLSGDKLTYAVEMTTAEGDEPHPPPGWHPAPRRRVRLRTDRPQSSVK